MSPTTKYLKICASFITVILTFLNIFWLLSPIVSETQVNQLGVKSAHNPSNHGEGYDLEVGERKEDHLWRSHLLRSSIRHMSGADTYAELGGLPLIGEQAEGRERKNRAIYDKKEPQEASSNSTTLALNSLPKIEFKKMMNKEDGSSSSSREGGATPLPEKIPFYLSDIWESTKPWTNVSTIGNENRLEFGYRNQAMAFSGLVLHTNVEGHGQILLDTIPHKDHLATNSFVPHAALFDVAHWNSFYPALPRLVRCDPDILPEYDCEKRKFKDLNGTFHKAPFKSTLRFKDYFGMYRLYTKGRGKLTEAGYPASADLLIQRGALKLHPKLMEIANSVLRDPATSGETIPYMTLHARVEPDMNKHDYCRKKKVTNLTQIFGHLEAQFPNPSFKRIFMPINRMMLEKGAVVDKSNLNMTDWISVDNLRALNHARDYGLWNGTVKVFESGARSIVGVPYYENCKSLVGAIVDFHIAQQGEVFVGTEVSSFSADLARVRFFSENFDNYFYRPDGLHKWTTGDMKHPAPFEC